MSFPITIEPAALDMLRRALSRRGEDGSFVRLGVKGGGCSGFEYLTKLDTVLREGDLVLEIEGMRIVCDPKSARFLEGARLVATGNLLGGGLKFENPNAERSCGCGTSFTPSL